jgi:hypothetical protein
MEHEVGKVRVRVFIADWNHYARELPTLKLLAYNQKIANSTRRTHGCGLQPPARWAKLRPELNRESATASGLGNRAENALCAMLCICAYMIPAVRAWCQVVPHPHILHRERPHGGQHGCQCGRFALGQTAIIFAILHE